MEKQGQSLFADKFRLLNSQENAEEINWSSSESSDFESVPKGLTNKLRHSNKKCKKRVLKNISNLDITVMESTKAHKEASPDDNGPTFAEKRIFSSRETSPILAISSLYFPPYKCRKITPGSPILTSKGCRQQGNPDLSLKSPILTLRYASPKASPKVKKNLFKTENPKELVAVEEKSTSVLLKLQENQYLDRRKFNLSDFNNFHSSKQFSVKDKDNLDEMKINNNNLITNKTLNLTDVNLETKLQEKTEESMLDDSYEKLKTTNTDLVKKIRSYFDSHFSSKSNSQQSISINDSLTPNQTSKTSDDIDIIASITQVKSFKLSSQIEPELATKNVSSASSESAELNMDKTKKIRYKKNGLAYRLNALLKKQSVNISLWQHERFLAENSNFVIPKGENVVFRIQKINFKYGCYLLKAVNMDNEKFLILINNIYVGNIQISADVIIKVYEPYKIFDYSRDCKLIINVCKFECLSY